jgi:hypothetical protein
MRREAVVVFILRNIVLVSISLVLILGFWYHGMFYQFGLTYLLLLGGAIVFGVIQAVRFAQNPTAFIYRGAGDFYFDRSDVAGIQNGTTTATVLFGVPEGLTSGMVLNARMDKKKPHFAKLVIRDIYRRRLGDLTDDEAQDAGFVDIQDSQQQLLDRWTRERGRPDPRVQFDDLRDEIVTMVQFERLNV